MTSVLRIEFDRRAESASGNTLVFSITLSQPATSGVTLSWRTYNGTGNEADMWDSNHSSGTFTIPAGQTTSFINLRLNGDSTPEPDETFMVELFNISGAVFEGGAQRILATGFVLDDDGTAEKRVLTVANAELVEGNAGTQQMVFKVMLSRPASTALSFDYRTIDGSAQAGSDYAAASGVLSFAAGQTEAVVSVAVNGDAVAEAEEFFTLLVTPQSAAVASMATGAGANQGLGYITDEDVSATLPEVSLRGVRQNETNLSYLLYEIVLSQPATSGVTLSWRTYNGTGNEADMWDSNHSSGTFTIPAGQTTSFIKLRLNGDSTPEPDETFFAEIFNPVGAVLAGGVDRLRASGVVLDDDGTNNKLVLVTGETRVVEGDDDNTAAVFVLELSRASATPITLSYQTADGTALAGLDYVASSGSVTFDPGQTLAAVPVPVVADLDVEATESFGLVIAPNPALANGGAPIELVGTIVTDDTQNPPTGANDRYTAYSGLTLTANAGNGVLVNDNDIKRNALTAQLVSPPSRGSLTLNSDGSFSYTPQAGFVGRDSFNYLPLDPFSSGSTATVWIDVRPASEAPGLVPQGAAFQVNGFTAGLQYAPAVAALTNGDFVAVWVSRGQDGSGDGVYAQLLSSSGAKLGGEFQISTTTAGHQQAPAVAAVGDGFVVAWDSAGQDGSLDAIVARRFLNNGTADGAEVVVNAATLGAQVAPALAARADGTLSVAWQGPRPARVDDAAWTQVVSSVLARNGSATVAGEGGQLAQGATQVLALSGGRSLLLWHGDNTDGSGFDVYGQRVGADQVVEGVTFRVNSHQPSYQTFPAATTLAGEGFVVVWSSYGQDGSEYGIYGQRYDSQGQRSGSEFQVSTIGAGSQERPAIAAMADGGFVVAWTREGATGAAVELQRFSPLGVKLGGVLSVDSGGASLRNVDLATGVGGGLLLLAESATAAGLEVVALQLTPPLAAQALDADLGANGDEVLNARSALTDAYRSNVPATLPGAQAMAAASGLAAPFGLTQTQTPAQERDSIAAAMQTGFGAFLNGITYLANEYSKAPSQADIKGGWAMFGVKLGAATFVWDFKTSREETNELKAADAAFKSFNGWAGGAAAAALTGAGIVVLAGLGVVVLAPLTATLVIGGAGLAGAVVAGKYGLESFRAYEAFSQRTGQQLADFLRTSADTVGTAFSDGASSARTALDAAAAKYGPLLEQAWDGFQQVAMRVGEQMATAAEQSLEAAQALWQTLKPQLEAAKDAAVAAASRGFDFVTDLARDVGAAGARVLQNTLDAVAGAIEDPPSLEAIRQAVADLLGDLAGPAADAMRVILNLFGLGERSIDPIVLDLDGDGVELIALSDSTVRFDMDADGFAELTAWVRADDGLLVLDRNLNGNIDDISELMGGADIDGYSELEIGDTNRDGSIDASDPIFDRLRIWRDADGNGRTDAGELSTLASLGIVAVSVRDVSVSYQIAGNLISAVSDFQRSDGSTGLAVDAWFRIDQLDAVVDAGSSFNQPYTLDLDTLQMPMLRGYGEVPDLYVAMSLRPALKQAVQALASTETADHTSVRAQVAQVLYLWADQAGVDPASRGRYVDARQLETLEAFTGETYRTVRGDANPPTAQAGNFVGQAWETLLQATMANLLVQTGFGGALTGARYDLATDAPRLVDPLATVVTRAVTAAPANANEALGYWKVVGPVLDLLQAGSGVSTADYRAMKDNAIAERNLGFSGGQLDNAVVAPGFDGARLDGSSFAEIFLGTSAAETFNGGQGSDTYLLSAARWGNDRILEVTSRSDETGSDVIVMPDGVLPNQVTISRAGSGFVLQRRDTDDQLVVESVNLLGADGDFGIETIRFSNGVTWTVASVLGALSVSAGAEATANESFAAQGFTRKVSITDPVDNGTPGWTWRVDWSDGATSSGTIAAGARSFDISRSFADSGALEATVTVTDDASEVDVDRFVLNVLNLAPTLTIDAPGTYTEAATYRLAITASDPAGSADPLTYRVDWGNGEVQTLTAQQLAVAGGAVTRTLPDAPGADGSVVNRIISVTVDDGDGGITTRQQAVVVTNVVQTFIGTAGDDALTSRPWGDIYNGLAGNDTISPGDGWDTIDGGTGFDRVVYSEMSTPVVASLAAGTAVIGSVTDLLAGIEALTGGSAADLLTGDANNNVFRGGPGDDTIDGGAGIDRAEFSGSIGSYTGSQQAGSMNIVITHKHSDIAVVGAADTNGTLATTTSNPAASALDGTDTLASIERVQFTDISVALDLDGNAGKVAKILGAVFGYAEVSNEVYVGIGLYYIDGGMTYESLTQLAIDARLGAGASHGEVVQLLYRNVVGFGPSAADEGYFVSLLDSKAYTVAGLGVLAADVDLNLANIDLVGLSQTGLAYTPYLGG